MAAVPSLVEILQTVPDVRSRRGRAFPLSAVLSLVVLGLLLGRRSLAGIARLNHDYQGRFALLLGFRHERTPTVSGLSRILARLDVAAFEQALTLWIDQCLRTLPPTPPAASAATTPAPTTPTPTTPTAAPLPPAVPLPLPPTAPPAVPLHMDGKTLRGSRIPEAELPGVHLVAAFAPAVQGVLAQVRVDAKTNEHKAALELLQLLPPRPGGYLITGDAAFCQKDLCQAVRDRGDHYLLIAKDNQPALVVDIEAGLSYAAQARTFSP